MNEDQLLEQQFKQEEKNRERAFWLTLWTRIGLMIVLTTFFMSYCSMQLGEI